MSQYLRMILGCCRSFKYDFTDEITHLVDHVIKKSKTEMKKTERDDIIKKLSKRISEYSAGDSRRRSKCDCSFSIPSEDIIPGKHKNWTRFHMISFGMFADDDNVRVVFDMKKRKNEIIKRMRSWKLFDSTGIRNGKRYIRSNDAPGVKHVAVYPTKYYMVNTFICPVSELEKIFSNYKETEKYVPAGISESKKYKAI